MALCALERVGLPRRPVQGAAQPRASESAVRSAHLPAHAARLRARAAGRLFVARHCAPRCDSANLHTWPAVRRRGPRSACDGPRRKADGRGAPRPRRGAAWRLGATRPTLPALIADRADAATRPTRPRGHAHGSPSSGAGPDASGENARRRLGKDSENAARSAARRGLRAQPRLRAGGPRRQNH